jgi:hypothetical protein
MRFSDAIVCARSTFFAVMGKNAPAFVEEFFEEVGGDGGAVFGGGADVVDGAGFGGEGGAGGGDGGRGDGLVEEGLLGGGAAVGSFAEAGGADADVCDYAALHLRFSVTSARPARATLEMAWALRVPTLRM